MHHIPLLGSLLIIIGVAAGIIAVMQRVGIPSIVAFLLTGVVVGPAGFGLVEDSEAIAAMAEIGVVLLLFTIGLEISIRELAAMWREVFIGGGLQILITFALGTAVALQFDIPTPQAIFAGLIVAASSTALVLRLLGDNGELGRPYGRLALGVLIMQDIAVVFLLLIVPMLASGTFDARETGTQLGKAVGLIVAIFIAARFLYPWLMRTVVKTRSREVFTLATLAVVFGTAELAGLAGLSLAVGAFIAGLVVSESIFSHQMLAEVLPFREIFNGLFFVSVGLLVSREALVGAPLMLAAAVLIVMVVKALIVFGVAKLLKLSLTEAILAGVSLSQVGEFAFVLAQQGLNYDLLSRDDYAIFISASVFTMLLTPAAIALGKRVTATINKRDGTENELSAIPENIACDDHVIVIGYGVNGRNTSRALETLGVRYIVAEMNIRTVEHERENGVPIVFADAVRPSVLDELHINKARALVVAISDPAATRQIVSAARHANPDLHIIARTRFVTELQPLIELGANEVVPEEFETSLQLTASVMRSYGASTFAIEREREKLRHAQYGALLNEDSSQHGRQPRLLDLLSDLELDYAELQDGDHGINSSLAELDLRSKTGASILAVVREDGWLANPPGGFRLSAGDSVVLVGQPEQIRAAREHLCCEMSDHTPTPSMSGVWQSA